MARPKARITFKYKDRERGWANELEAAVWPPSDRAPEGAPDNVRFPRGAKLTLENGTVYNLDDFWVGLKVAAPVDEDPGF